MERNLSADSAVVFFFFFGWHTPDWNNKFLFPLETGHPAQFSLGAGTGESHKVVPALSIAWAWHQVQLSGMQRDTKTVPDPTFAAST